MFSSGTKLQQSSTFQKKKQSGMIRYIVHGNYIYDISENGENTSWRGNTTRWRMLVLTLNYTMLVCSKLQWLKTSRSLDFRLRCEAWPILLLRMAGIMHGQQGQMSSFTDSALLLNISTLLGGLSTHMSLRFMINAMNSPIYSWSGGILDMAGWSSEHGMLNSFTSMVPFLLKASKYRNTMIG